MIWPWCDLENNHCHEALHDAAAPHSGLAQHMKSMSLAFTLFTLTGALVMLDLSGELGVQPLHQQLANAASISQAYGGTPYQPVNAEAEQTKMSRLRNRSTHFWSHHTRLPRPTVRRQSCSTTSATLLIARAARRRNLRNHVVTGFAM